MEVVHEELTPFDTSSYGDYAIRSILHMWLVRPSLLSPDHLYEAIECALIRVWTIRHQHQKCEDADPSIGSYIRESAEHSLTGQLMKGIKEQKMKVLVLDRWDRTISVELDFTGIMFEEPDPLCIPTVTLQFTYEDFDDDNIFIVSNHMLDHRRRRELHEEAC